MYILLVFLQVIATLVCFSAVLVVAFQRESSYSNIIVITFICAFIQNGGYILELLSRNVSEGLIAVKTEYLGGAFEICLLTFFIFKYCGHEFNKWFKAALILEGIIVLFGVWSYGLTNIYYTGVEFIADAPIPHLVMTHGWLYYAYAVTTVVELISCLFILVVSILKSNQEHMKYNYVVLAFVVLIPFLGFLLSVSGALAGYDATPLSCATAVGLFAFEIAGKHVFDVADAAGELILANMDNAIIIINTEGGYEYSNNRANSLFPVLKEYNRGNIINDPEIKSIIDEKIDSRITIGDSMFEVRANLVRVREQEIGKTVILFDVTESSKQIEKMKKQMEEAEDANRLKTSFLTNVSHEIRTPINVITGMSEIMLRNHATKETEEYLINIKNSGEALVGLINDILDYSKIETGKLELKEQKFDLQKGLIEMVDVYDFRCKQKALTFEAEISSDIPRFLIGDEFRIKQVLNNLLSNSVNYTDKGSVRFKLGYKLRSDFDVDLIVAIEDTGIGIKREDYDTLFAGLMGVDERKTEMEATTGLGLSITKQIVELMGGIINFKSEYGKGTVFSLIIPVKCTVDSNETVGVIVEKKDDDKVYKTTFTCPRARILLVDDSNISLMVTKALLKELKPEVTTVTSGEKCLDIIAEKKFDLIFLDHRMPGMDGVETLARMRQTEHQCMGVPVVVFTANASSTARDYYVSRGFTDFVLKPAALEQLANVCYKYLPENLIEGI